jgi:threonine-phosphate decarboxylase
VLLDFSTSLNPLGPPPAVYRALRRQLQGGAALEHYPDPACTVLRERLVALHGVAPNQVVLGNGSSELIQAIPLAFCCRRVAIVEPTYTEYLRASLLARAAVTHWLAEGDDFVPEPFDPEDAQLIWLCNPNNPTGRLWPHGVLPAWMAAHPGTLFVVDESFLPFRPDEAEHSLIPHLSRLPNLVVVRSLTKLYALPGVRLGYAVTSPEYADLLRARLVPWSVNAFAQVAGVAALKDQAYLGLTHAWFRSETQSVMAALQKLTLNLRVVPSEANFVLLRLRSVSSAWLLNKLRAHSIRVRDASNFIGLDEHYVRIGLHDSESNRSLVRQLAECLNPKHGKESSG